MQAANDLVRELDLVYDTDTTPMFVRTLQQGTLTLQVPTIGSVQDILEPITTLTGVSAHLCQPCHLAQGHDYTTIVDIARRCKHGPGTSHTACGPSMDPDRRIS